MSRGPGTTPRNFTWNIEGDRELLRNVVLRVGYIDSHTTYLFVVNPFTGAAGENSFLGLTNTGSSHYRELESTVRFSVHEHNEVNASYIWSRTLGDLNNLSDVMIPFLQPVIRSNVYGILPYDVPQRVIAWGVFSLPKKLTFSPILDVHSGYPYSNVDVLQNYVGTPNGQRFATYLSLDVKIYRVFQVPFLGAKSGKIHHMRLGILFAQRHESRQFQRHVQQCDGAELRPVCRISWTGATARLSISSTESFRKASLRRGDTFFNSAHWFLRIALNGHPARI